MFTPNMLQSRPDQRVAASRIDGARSIYDALFREPDLLATRSASRAFLQQQLLAAAHEPCDMPSRPELLSEWLEAKALATGDLYAAYLQSRKAGQPRRFFTCRSHALSFLQRVAPTKLVDGAWLYGLLQNWKDVRFYPLIRTYLEELGDGDPAQNHVVLYQRLLAEHGCENLPELSDDHYLQGAIQLALGYHAEEFTPEVIGYNLGYEQLPLHLLISAFELNELDIDPYYFTLHVTIDNASSGHARKAVQSVIDTMPTCADAQLFMERVANGYRLNELGLGSTEVIDSFDLEQELVDMLERKRLFGKQVHSDFCRIEGRTVNEWLSVPGQIRAFLQAMENRNWIKRHQDPRNSRFWQLIDGSDAQMFGVFSPFEKQLLEDWIAGDWFGESVSQTSATNGRPQAFRPRARRKVTAAMQPLAPIERAAGDVDEDVAGLNAELKRLAPEQRMARLIELMAPSSHATAAGLQATRLFTLSLA